MDELRREIDELKAKLAKTEADARHHEERAVGYEGWMMKQEAERDELKAKLADMRALKGFAYESIAKQAEKERDELKAKLAEAENLLSEALGQITVQVNLATEARAEAAALREAVEYASAVAPVKVMGALAILKEAVSHPGPGAALLERVAKLEAVAEASRRVGIPVNNDGHATDCGCCSCELDRALVALGDGK